MANRDGTPIWYELLSDAPDASQKFYKKVMRWTFEPMPGAPDFDYRIASAKKQTVAGLMKTPADAQHMSNMWFVYFGVSDVDASAAMVRALGGRVDIEPADLPGVGRFALCADPMGASFYLMRGDSDEDSTSFAMAKSGHPCWNELITSNQSASLAFYGRLFGWEHGGAMSMGPAGDYTFFNHEGVMIGGMMNTPTIGAPAHWCFALQVPNIDTTKSAIEKAGGTVQIGPDQLPSDSGWLIRATDPEGAEIMFVGKRKS